jgi:hypothetical protein
MKKYKQTVIPEASTKEWSGLKPLATRKKVLEYYRIHYLTGHKVINKDLGIAVQFEAAGAKKTSFGGNIYPEKACLVEVLDKLIRYAEYSNWGDKKVTDALHVIGYMNFKVKVRIDGRIEHIHLVIRVTNDGKFHYTLEINVWHQKKPLV